MKIWLAILLLGVAKPAHQPNWGPDSAYGQQYNPATMQAISGEVLTVDQFLPKPGMGYGTLVVLNTKDGPLTVHLGPSWYINRQELAIEPQDQIRVVGSRVNYEDESILMAAEVEKENHLLILRDQSGYPVWSGWRLRSKGFVGPSEGSKTAN